MASTRQKADPHHERQRKGNDEQEAGYPYGGDRTPGGKAKSAYLNPRREAAVADSTSKSRAARPAAARRRPPRPGP